SGNAAHARTAPASRDSSVTPGSGDAAALIASYALPSSRSAERDAPRALTRQSNVAVGARETLNAVRGCDVADPAAVGSSDAVEAVLASYGELTSAAN